MGKGSGGGAPKSTTTKSEPWAPAQGALKDILAQAGTLFGRQGGIDTPWIQQKLAGVDPATQAALAQLASGGGMQQFQQQYGQMAGAGLGGYQQALGQLGTGSQPITGRQVQDLTSQYYNQAGLDRQFAGLGEQAKQMLGEAQAGISGGAIQGGTLGGGRTLLQRGQAAGQAQAGLQAQMAGLQQAELARAQQQALGQLSGNRAAQLQAASQMGQLGLAGGQAGMAGGVAAQRQMLQNMMFGGGMQQQRQQQELDVSRMNQLGQQQAGWDALSRYLGLAGPIGGMGGTNFGQNKMGSQSMHGSDYMQLAATAGMMMFSDRRLKDNIQRIGKYGDLDLCVWHWNDKAKEVGADINDPVGFIAQEVQVKYPDFVVKDSSGYLRINYQGLLNAIDKKKEVA